MAVIERIMEQHGDPVNPALKATIYCSYDDQSMLATQVRAVNNTTRPLHIELIRANKTGTPVSVDIAAGQSLQRNLPSSTNARFAVTLTPWGALDGIEWRAYLT